MGDAPVYVTFDVDALDPAYALGAPHPPPPSHTRAHAHVCVSAPARVRVCACVCVGGVCGGEERVRVEIKEAVLCV